MTPKTPIDESGSTRVDDVLGGSGIGLLHRLPYENSIATICFEGTVWQKIDAAANAGFDSIEIMPDDLQQASAEEVIAYCKSKNLKVSILQPFKDLEGFDSSRFNERMVAFEDFLKQSRVLETNTILLCANCNPAAKDDVDLVVSQLKSASAIARKYSVNIAYENLSWATHNYTLEKLVDVVVAVDELNFGICFDLFHINIHNSSLECLENLGHKVFFVQYCDSPRLRDLDIQTHARNYRVFPFQGEYSNLVSSMDLLSRLQYKGPISLEVFNSSYKDAPESCTCVAQDALRSLVYLQALYSNSCKGTELLSQPKVTGIEVGSDGCKHIDLFFDTESDKQRFCSRAIQLGYSGFFNSLQVKRGRTSQTLIVPSRLMYNRYTLVLRALLGFEADHKSETNVSGRYGLPEKVLFANDQGVTIVLCIARSD